MDVESLKLLSDRELFQMLLAMKMCNEPLSNISYVTKEIASRKPSNNTEKLKDGLNE